MVSIEEELRVYYEKCPREKIHSFRQLCAVCAGNIRFLGLRIGEVCEGCHYEILSRDGHDWVAIKHVDGMSDLRLHDCVNLRSGTRVIRRYFR